MQEGAVLIEDEQDQIDGGDRRRVDERRTVIALLARYRPGRATRVAPETTTTAAVWPWLFTLSVVAASVAIRVWHRADVIPGWDVISVALGSWLTATNSLAENLSWQLQSLRKPGFWNLYVAPAVLVPGALARWWPWLYWGHAVSFATTLATLALLASAFRLGWRGGWLVLLGWATSSTLVSQSLTGLIYVSALLPHALALWTVLRLRTRPLATVAAGVVVWLAGWQAQELGRTTSLTFLAAGLLVPAPRTIRLCWLGAGGAILLDTLWYPTQNTNAFTSVGLPTPAVVWDAASGIATRLFAPPWIDLPTLLVLGVTAALLVRTDRWLWRALLAAQLGLIVVLALQRGVGSVWPRRFIVADFYALAATIALSGDWLRQDRRRPLRMLVVVLALGATWQLADTVRFTRQGAPGGRTTAFTMPFVHTTVDYHASAGDAEWTRRMLADVRDGKRLVLAYNLSSYAENPTNPSAIFERLQVALGPERYAAHVHFFGKDWRWNHTRGRPPSEIAPFAESITDPDAWVGWYSEHPNDAWKNASAARRRVEVEDLLAALERRFVLHWEPPLAAGLSKTQRFTLGARRIPADGVCREPPGPD